MLKIRTTDVLIAVATLELTFYIPIFAKIEVKAAKIAENTAKINYIIPLLIKLFFYTIAELS